MTPFSLACSPTHVQVELARGAGGCIRKVSCVGRKRERSASQVVYPHSGRNGHCRDLRDLDGDIIGVGHACGRDAQAAQLKEALDRRIAAIRARSLQSRSKVTVLYILGLPGYAAGPHSFLNDMIEAAGGINVAASAGEPYPNLSAEAIVKMDPDVIIVSHDTPFDADVRVREPWRSLRAVRTGRVLRPPSDDIMERNGPRIVTGLAWLHDALAR